MAQDEDDLPRRAGSKPPDLATWSIEEVEAYIVRLQAEIERATAAIRAKQSVRGAAESVFRSRR
jgi:uncharacterized small protein (DUF1192 family)